MSETPELSALRQGLNDSYLDQWGNTLWSPTRPGQVATLREIAEMRVAQTVGPAPRQEAAPKAVVGKPELSRKDLAAIKDPFERRDAVLSGRYQIVD